MPTPIAGVEPTADPRAAGLDVARATVGATGSMVPCANAPPAIAREIHTKSPAADPGPWGQCRWGQCRVKGRSNSADRAGIDRTRCAVASGAVFAISRCRRRNA